MHVLHLCAGNRFGGVERTLLALWRARGACALMRPHFGLCFEGRLAAALRGDGGGNGEGSGAGAPVAMLGRVRARWPWTVLAARWRLRRLLEREAVDVVVAHGLWPQAVFGPAVRGAGVPLVTWLHDVPRERGWLERWAGGVRPDLVLANSRWTAAAASRRLGDVPIGRCCPVMQVPDVPGCRGRRGEVRAALGTAEGRFLILLASRLRPAKGLAILIDALSQLPRELDWECWIAGEADGPGAGRFVQQMRGRVRAGGMGERVRFLGHREDVPSLLAAADVLCQPNTAPEGFGLIFAEAMAAGVPIITSDLGAAREVLDGACAVLVPPGDAAAVARALCTMAAGSPPHPSSRPRALEQCRPAAALPHLGELLRGVQKRV